MSPELALPPRRRAGPTLSYRLVPAAVLPAERPLFIDDERDPAEDGKPWVVVRTYADAVGWMTRYGIPRYISFDHDLGDPSPGTSGAAVARWIIERDLDAEGTALPEGFDYFVHSQNREGAADIVGKLDGYLRERAKRRGERAPAPARRAAVLR